MLPEKNRLKKKKDFKEILKKGRGFKEDFLIAKIKKNEFKEARLGFIVSRKVSKKAVVRNRIKRRLREVAKLRIGEIKEHVDIVLIALPGTATKNFKEIKETMEKLLVKAGLLKL